MSVQVSGGARGFGTLPNKLFCGAKYESGYPLSMLAAKLLIWKGRERNGKGTKNGKRTYRGEKYAVSGASESLGRYTIRQDALPFYRQL